MEIDIDQIIVNFTSNQYHLLKDINWQIRHPLTMTLFKRIQIDFQDQNINDKLACFLWFSGSILWIAGFIFPNQQNVDIISTNLARSLGLLSFNGLIIYAPIFFGSVKQSSKLINHKSEDSLNLRSFILSLYSFMFSQAHFYLPSPMVYTIFFSGPLFVLLIEYIVYQQKITKDQGKGVIAATIGVFLTANGIAITTFFIGQSQKQNQFATNFEHYKTDNPYVKSLVAIILIVMQVGWGYAAVIVRYIKNTTPYQANFNFGIILLIMTGLVFPYNTIDSFRNNYYFFIKTFFISGLTLAVSQLCFMKALLLTQKKGMITMVGFLGVVFSEILSIFRYDQQLNLICLIGVILVIIGIHKITKKST